MPGSVRLEVTQGPMKGKTIAFEEHDTFLFGRLADCHASLPDDSKVSRRHFILEANPPDARIRDFGSMNGTYVNDRKIGSREDGETPEEGAKRQYPEVELKDGDRIKVGQTVISVHLEAAAICSQCNTPIADADRPKSAWPGGTFICPPCKGKLISLNQKPKAAEPVRCQKCKKDVSAEVGKNRRGDYVCESCRDQGAADPMAMAQELLQGLGHAEEANKSPAIRGYDIEKRIGLGGFGAVYLARRKNDNAPVAIKVMLARIAVDEVSRNKFLHEVELTKALRHDHIVSLLDQGSEGGIFYFVMDFCEGGSIDKLMARCGGQLSITEAQPLMLQALDGLGFLHSQDVIHRDIKPGNILLAGSEGNWRAKISDFGLAKNFQKAGLSGMSVTGSFAGTPAFMPREQILNFKYAKPVTDIWSIGATFYNMLTGELPRDFPPGKDEMQVILNGGIVPIRKRDSAIPKKLAEVIDRAIVDETQGRWQSACEMRNALESAL